MRALLIVTLVAGLMTTIPVASADASDDAEQLHEQLATTCVEVSLTHMPPIYTYECEAGLVPP